MWVQLQPKSSEIQANKKAEINTRNKVVQSNAGLQTKEAAPDAYLGEKTRTVDRQTVNSRKATEMGRPTPQVAPKAQAERKTQQAKAETKIQPEKSLDKSKTLSKLGMAILPESRRSGATQELAKDEPQWANIGSQAQDYVDGIKQSDRTALNTREYQFFGYHQRIRQRLELEWTRMLRDTLTRFYRSGRHLANDMEYTTKILVVLNSSGEITKVKVLGMSGTQELDDVAVKAFNRAGPFPNPPQGLVRNGEIEVPWELKLRS
jgi:TonB family protein